MNLQDLLVGMGLNVASSFVYDAMGRYFASTPSPTVQGLQQNLESALRLQGVQVNAERIIEFLAKTGDITISRSSLFATMQITMASVPGRKFVFGDGSESRTSTTAIQAGAGAYIVGTGNARVQQNPDGSITFHT